MVITAKCPKCRQKFSAAVTRRNDRIVLTPCCGWVGPGRMPEWAKRYRKHEPRT